MWVPLPLAFVAGAQRSEILNSLWSDFAIQTHNDSSNFLGSNGDIEKHVVRNGEIGRNVLSFDQEFPTIILHGLAQNSFDHPLPLQVRRYMQFRARGTKQESSCFALGYAKLK